MKVAVIGAQGKMGRTICEAVETADDLSLVAHIDQGDNLAVLIENDADVAIDVTHIVAARQNLPWLAQNGIHAVVGTTGFEDEDVAALHDAFVQHDRSCFLVPNFSIGAVLMMRFAEQAAQYFDGVEIIELHHENKKDAPSGSAQLTADRIDAVRTRPWASDPTEHVSLAGVRGGRTKGGVQVHSVRLPGLLAHQEVLFGSAGQVLTIRHDSFDRSAFMPGVLLATRRVAGLQRGVTFGLDAVLD